MWVSIVLIFLIIVLGFVAGWRMSEPGSQRSAAFSSLASLAVLALIFLIATNILQASWLVPLFTVACIIVPICIYASVTHFVRVRANKEPKPLSEKQVKKFQKKLEKSTKPSSKKEFVIPRKDVSQPEPMKETVEQVFVPVDYQEEEISPTSEVTVAPIDAEETTQETSFEPTIIHNPEFEPVVISSVPEPESTAEESAAENTSNELAEPETEPENASEESATEDSESKAESATPSAGSENTEDSESDTEPIPVLKQEEAVTTEQPTEAKLAPEVNNQPEQETEEKAHTWWPEQRTSSIPTADTLPEEPTPEPEIASVPEPELTATLKPETTTEPKKQTATASEPEVVPAKAASFESTEPVTPVVPEATTPPEPEPETGPQVPAAAQPEPQAPVATPINQATAPQTITPAPAADFKLETTPIPAEPAGQPVISTTPVSRPTSRLTTEARFLTTKPTSITPPKPKPQPNPAEQYAEITKKAGMLRAQNQYAIAAVLFEKAAGIAPTAAESRNAQFEELSCYVKADDIDKAKALARTLRQSNVLTRFERIKLDAVERMS